MDLTGQAAFLTGAGHGIGRATALLFAERGINLAVADLNHGDVIATAEECQSYGVRVLALELDQRKSGSVDAALAKAGEEFGAITVAANIAGIYPFATVDEMDDDLWSSIISTNLTGTFYCCRAQLNLMRSQGFGVIINVASGAAFRGMAGLSAYGASKAGIVAFSRALAVEAAPAIRVNVVAPGPTSSDAQPPSTDTHLVSTLSAQVANDIPLGRTAQPREIAESIYWLATDRSSFVTGHVLHVNGGRFMA